MKTKISQLIFTTVLVLTLNLSHDIGGPTLPPKPPTGPAYKPDQLVRSLSYSTEKNPTGVTRY